MSTTRFAFADEPAATEVRNPSLAAHARRMLMHRLFNLSTTDLGFSSGLQQALYDAGVDNVGELVRHSEAVLLRWRGFGRGRIAEIKQRLAPLGLTLGMESTDGQVPPIIDLLARSIERQPSLGFEETESVDFNRFGPARRGSGKYAERMSTVG